VREIAADVRSHVLATGEDPVQAFGQPADYARQWTHRSPARRFSTQIVAASLGVLGLGAVGKGLVAETAWRADLPVSVGNLVVVGLWVTVWVLVPWPLDIWLARRAAKSFGRAPRVPGWVIRNGGLLVFSTVVIVGIAWIGAGGPLDSERATGASAPRWVFVAGGLALVPLFFLAKEPSSMRAVPTDPLHRARSRRQWLREVFRLSRPYRGG
ncbi:MAG: hypothetical protein ABI249_02540, partial [Ornithinibacter sp.]